MEAQGRLSARQCLLCRKAEAEYVPDNPLYCKPCWDRKMDLVQTLESRHAAFKEHPESMPFARAS